MTDLHSSDVPHLTYVEQLELSGGPEVIDPRNGLDKAEEVWATIKGIGSTVVRPITAIRDFFDELPAANSRKGIDY